MRRDLPSEMATKVVATATTLTVADIKIYGNFVVNTTSAAVTLTLPTPCLELNEWEARITNDGATYNATLACTNGFIRDGDSIVIDPGGTMVVVCCKDRSSAYRWVAIGVSTGGATGLSESVADIVGAMFTGNTETNITCTYQDADNTIDVVLGDHDHSTGNGGAIPTSSITSLAEYIADTAGAMVTGNTETGIAVTYEDSDNTLDFVVAYGTSASTACEGNDSRLSDARTPTAHTTASHSDYTEWTTWTPTLVFAAAGDPTSLTTVARYRKIGRAIEFVLDISGTDGDGKTLVSATLPVAPADINTLTSCAATAWVNGALTVGAAQPGAFIDQTDATEGNRLLKPTNCPTFTDAQAYQLNITGRYETAT